MATRIKLSLVLLVISLFSMAQNKKSFTLDDLLPGGSTYHKLQPVNMFTTWWGDVCVENSLEACYRINTSNGKKSVLFTLDQINEWTGASKEQPFIHSCYYLTFPYADKPYVFIQTPGKFTLVDFKKGETVWTTSLPKEASHIDWSRTSKFTAYNRAGNLYVMNNSGKEIAVSEDGSNDLVYGQSVHRDEFGIVKGTFWSPDGKLLAFYRMDQSMVPDYPQVDISTRIATTFSCKYPMAGEAMHKVTVGVFNPETNSTVWLKAGDPTDRYFTNITWSPDAKSIYMIELNREQNKAELVEYNAADGERIRTIYTESHDKYVEPMTGLTFLPWDNSKFIYQSQRDGFNHLYIFDLNSVEDKPVKEGQDGESKWSEYCKVTQITSGEWIIKDILGFNQKDKSVIVRSNEQHPLHMNIYSIRLNKDYKRTILTPQTGVHYASLSRNGQYIVDNFSSPEVTRCINVVNTSNAKSCNLLNAEDPWKEYNVPEITSGSIKAADGTTDLFYRMVKPVDFDPNKKYPAVIYVYGGPHAHNVEASRNWMTRGWEIYMAQKGYLIFVLDNRGSENRGLDFENVTFRHFGDEEMKDQMKGVEYLKSLPYVDSSKIGVHGWSFGGYMTTNLMLTYPDVFKVGVAGGPVIDWKYYEVMYGERYMDTPQNNPEGYKGSSLLLKAPNLKGKLQIIIGYNDPVCVPQHSLAFMRACIDAGRQVDFFAYPGGEHNMFGKDRIHLHERITQYFEDYLK